MTYKNRYTNNSLFPYSQYKYTLKKTHQKDTSYNNDYNFSFIKNSNSFGVISKFLEPIEKIIGRKINFDDIILVALIYILYTEKNNENNTLLLCLIFVLLG